MRPEDRIRMLMESVYDDNARQAERLARTVPDIGPMEGFEDLPADTLSPDVPSVDHVSVPVYVSQESEFFQPRTVYSLTPPKPPSKAKRVAAALQKRKQILGRP